MIHEYILKLQKYTDLKVQVFLHLFNLTLPLGGYLC